MAGDKVTDNLPERRRCSLDGDRPFLGRLDVKTGKPELQGQRGMWMGLALV